MADFRSLAQIRTSGRTRLTAVIVACAMFMQNLDSTVIATALPTMAKAFGADPVHMNVALTSYLLSPRGVHPGQRLDRRPLRHAHGVPRRDRGVHHRLGAVRPGRQPGLPGRLAHPARHRRRDDGAGRPAGAAAHRGEAGTGGGDGLADRAGVARARCCGPPVGGFIVTYFSWRWIFDINMPIGILGIVLVSLFVEDVREPPRGRFDGIGLLLCGIALAGLMFGLETAGRGVVPQWHHRGDDRRRSASPSSATCCMRGGIRRRCSICR